METEYHFYQFFVQGHNKFKQDKVKELCMKHACEWAILLGLL